MSSRLTISKVGSLVLCLCKLHNFCINERIKRNQPEGSEQPLSALAQDLFAIASEGGVPFEVSRDLSPEQILHGGEHFDDLPRDLRRQTERLERDEVLPRDVLHNLVELKSLTRPLPSEWRKQSQVL